MKPLACLVVAALSLVACDSDPNSVDRVFGTDEERAQEQEQLNAISEQDDANNADAGITNDAQMEPLNP
jgi:hypothetical protein